MIETWWGERECPSLEAYYDERCLFPIDIYEGITGKPVAMILRLGTALRKYEALRSIRRNRFACIVANSARSSGERVSDASHLMRIFGRPCVTGGPSLDRNAERRKIRQMCRPAIGCFDSRNHLSDRAFRLRSWGG